MKIKYTLLALAASTALLASCQDAKLSSQSDRAYIAQTATQAGRIGSITLGEDGASIDLNVRLSDVQTGDQSYTLELSQEALDQYNKRNKTSYTLLPAAQVTIPGSEVVIKAGSVFSDPLTVKLKPLTTEQSKSGKKYAVAFRLTPKGGSLPVVEGADTYVYGLKTVTVTTAPILGTYRGQYYKAKAVGLPVVELPRFTVEMRVNMNGFRRNNQALFGSFHSGSEIYMRFGDANPPYNYLNIKFGAGGQIDRTFDGAQPNTWYHIALVYDGAQARLYVNGALITTTDKPAGRVFTLAVTLNIAGSGMTWFVNSCMFSELRIWNVVRTPEQLKDNEYVVDPSTPGLLHYWRMDEGQGREFANSVKGMPSLKVMDGYDKDQTPVWVSNVRSDGQGTTRVP